MLFFQQNKSLLKIDDRGRVPVENLRKLVKSTKMDTFIQQFPHMVLVGKSYGAFRTKKDETEMLVFPLICRRGVVTEERAISLGRDTNNTLVLPDAFVSTWHLTFHPVDSGVEIEDCNSTTGTKLNEKTLIPLQRYALEDEDQLRIANYRFQVYGPAAFYYFLTEILEVKQAQPQEPEQQQPVPKKVIRKTERKLEEVSLEDLAPVEVHEEPELPELPPHRQQVLDQVERLPFFNFFTAQEKQRFALDEIEVTTIPEQTQVIAEGSKDPNLYLLLSGQARAINPATKKTVSTYKPGTLFGEMGFLANEPSLYEIESQQQMEVMAITPDALSKLSWDIQEKMRDALIRRLLRLNDFHEKRLLEKGLSIPTANHGDDAILVGDGLAALVNHAELFSDFTDLEKQRLTKIPHNFKMLYPEDCLIQEGQVGKAFFLVLYGQLAAYKGDDPTPLSLMNSGSCFGETAYFESAPRTATVKATKPSTVLVFDDKLMAYLGVVERDKIKLKIIDTLVARFKRNIALLS
ncbi:cyclic nucleotide-binding domain-containing protein [Magnetococcus sp. PR-3]|uniref:cyclic nucleotide-binding domain-containing protein n=1 Tax=Magnetococcus sp. PR-3 TaxID=3120355 RepID=UPI002FCE4166